MVADLIHHSVTTGRSKSHKLRLLIFFLLLLGLLFFLSSDLFLNFKIFHLLFGFLTLLIELFLGLGRFCDFLLGNVFKKIFSHDFIFFLFFLFNFFDYLGQFLFLLLLLLFQVYAVLYCHRSGNKDQSCTCGDIYSDTILTIHKW